jgi:hypothetical protein
VRVGVPLAVVATAGCSVFDGWSGLEGGDASQDAVRSDAGGDSASGGRDAAAPADAASGDDAPASGGDAAQAADVADEWTFGMGASCGNARCDYLRGEGCCVGPTGSASCATAMQCTGAGNWFLMCDGPYECSHFGSQGDTCCLELGTTNEARCTTGTCSGLVLCSGPGGQCPPGTACTASTPPALPSGTYVCR